MVYETHNTRRKKLESSHRKRQLDFIYSRDDGICQICLEHVDRADASRDHIKRLSECTKEEARDVNNQRLAHIECNQDRQDYDVEPVRPLVVHNKNGTRRLSTKIGFLFPELSSLTFHGSDE